MQQHNIEFLERNRDCYSEIIHAQTATRANKIKMGLYRIMKEEFLPGYAYADECGTCLFDMTLLIYRLFDEWKAKQPKEEPLAAVKATFPSHKEDQSDVLDELKAHLKGDIPLLIVPTENLEWNKMPNPPAPPAPNKNHKRK